MRVGGGCTGGWAEFGTAGRTEAGDVAAGSGVGEYVASGGDTAIVGAFSDDDKGFWTGSAYVYRRDQGGVDNWGQVTKITASDGAAYDVFGDSVAISGDTAIVGAFADDDNGTQSGSAYVLFFPPADIPAVSEWGLMVMALLMLTAGTLVYTRRLRFSPSIREG